MTEPKIYGLFCLIPGYAFLFWGIGGLVMFRRAGRAAAAGAIIVSGVLLFHGFGVLVGR